MYKMDGTVVKTFTVVGHNDGLRYDIKTGDLWALQNEDANATLIIIDPNTGKQKTFVLGTGPHGGGYDDLDFEGNAIYVSASNPSIETAPGIARLKFKGKKVELTGILNDDATATDVTTGETVTLNLTDPDSMIVDPFGELLLDSQGDGELIIVQHPGRSCQKNLLVPLTSPLADGTVPGDTTADDTVFANAAQGTLLVADKDGEAVYAITAPYFAPGAAYTAIVSVTAPGGSTVVGAFVGADQSEHGARHSDRKWAPESGRDGIHSGRWQSESRGNVCGGRGQRMSVIGEISERLETKPSFVGHIAVTIV